MIVYKYLINGPGHNKVQMPASARIISTGLDPQGHMAVWAVIPHVADAKVNVVRIITAWPTGYAFEQTDFGRFIGTVVQGPIVLHVFDQPGAP